jgi:hypothetical protein
LSSTASVFIVLAGDGWTAIFFDHYRVVGSVTSTFFFVSLIILGQLILFNLFLSILLKEFDDDLILKKKPTGPSLLNRCYARCFFDKNKGETIAWLNKTNL